MAICTFAAPQGTRDWGMNFKLTLPKSEGENSLRPFSHQRPMMTNLSLCLGLIANHGQHKSTNRLQILRSMEEPADIQLMVYEIKM